MRWSTVFIIAAVVAAIISDSTNVYPVVIAICGVAFAIQENRD